MRVFIVIGGGQQIGVGLALYFEMFQYDGGIPDLLLLLRRLIPEQVAAKLVLSLQQVVALSYRTQDRVSLQQVLLGSHELVIAGRKQTIVANHLRRRLPVDGDDGRARINGG